MTSLSGDYDSKRLRELASAMMDGTATQAEQQQLTELLRETPSARDEYLALVDLHAVLATDLASPLAVPVSAPQRTKDDFKTTKRSSHRSGLRLAGIIALAASLLIAVSLRFAPTQNTEQQKDPSRIAAKSLDTEFASVTHLTDATWPSKSVLEVGDRLGTETIRIQSGFIQLSFDDGVEVTLEGPAEYALIAAGKTKLNSGLLTATVPPGAEGFTVETPTAEVVDLGTSFGVDLREDGFSRVSVFDGEVEVAASRALEKQLLTEGQSVRIGSNQQIEKVEFDPGHYAGVWPIASGINGSTDAFRFIPPWPKRISLVSSDEDIFIATEGHSMDLSNELQVNISEPGQYARVEELTPAVLKPSQRIRSYILHYSPVTKVGPRRAKRLSGSITFSNPVLGLIVQHDELVASSRRFTWRGAGEGQPRRELNLAGDNSGDRISLSEDRRTINVDVTSPGKSSDLIRVIVEGNRRYKPPRRRRR